MLRILHAGGIIDGNDRLSITDPEIHVANRKIKYVGPSSTAPIPNDTEVEHVQLGAATLMPGMIDCHVHPVPSPIPPDPYESIVGEDQVRVLRAAYELQKALRAGITTFRDCGAPHDTGFALKRAVEMDVIPGPRLVVSGPIVCPTGGHGHTLGAEVDGSDDMSRMTRLLFKKGADFIKVTATGGSDTLAVRHHGTFTTEELCASVEESKRHDSYVTAHAHGIEGMIRCLDAGVQMLEHATFVGLDGEEHLDRSLVRRIRDQNVIVCPTVCIHGRWLEQVAEQVPRMDPERLVVWQRRSEGFKRRLEIVAALHDAGVPILMGSDAASRQRSYPSPLDDLAYSLALHVNLGIAPIDVIRSTTSAAADAIGLGSVTGRLEAGKDADIIAVDGDPLTDISVMQNVKFVMVRGFVARFSREA